MEQPLKGKKIGVLIESDFYEPEIYYYQHRFAEEGIELVFLTRLWGQKAIAFQGHEHHIIENFQEESLEPENMTDEKLASFDAIIVPSGMVSDRLRYTEDVTKLPPASVFLQRAFANPNIIKGIICHGMWLVSPVPELIKGRKAVVHNNLYSDLKNMGGIYVNEDVVVDGDDLVTARSGGHCHFLAGTIIQQLKAKAAKG